MKRFVIYWLNGMSETIEGFSFTNALLRAGYGKAASASLHCYKEVGLKEE